jgi:hypothetical protein
VSSVSSLVYIYIIQERLVGDIYTYIYDTGEIGRGGLEKA